MSFFEQKKKKTATFFKISGDTLERAAGRMKGYLKSKGISVVDIIYSLQFLVEEIEKEQKKITKVDFVYNFRDIKLQKYQAKIIELFKQGYGAQRIAKFLYQTYKIKISKSTIENFLKKNNITRNTIKS